MAAGFIVALTEPAEAGVVAIGLAEAALFVFVVAVASAAFFFVGIVAFRSVGAAAFVAAVLVETVVTFGVGLVALVAGVLVFAWPLTGVGLEGAPWRAVLGAGANLGLLAAALVAVLAGGWAF